MKSRKTIVQIEYAGKNISTEIAKSLISFSFTDNTADNADEINLTIADREGNWIGDWFPKVRTQPKESASSNSSDNDFEDNFENDDLDDFENDDLDDFHDFTIDSTQMRMMKTKSNADFSDITAEPKQQKKTIETPKSNSKKSYAQTGTIIKASIISEDNGKKSVLNCGSFEVDSIEIAGPPSVVSIKAVSVPLSSSLRREQRTQAWDDVSVAEVAADIANRGGLKLIFDVEDNPLLDRVEQRREPDLPFLQQLCRENGISLKVSDDQLILFEQSSYESRAISATIEHSSSKIISWSFSMDSSETASSASVSFKDPKSAKMVNVTFTPEEPPAVGQELKLNSRPGFMKADAFRGGVSSSGNSATISPFSSFGASKKGNKTSVDDFSDITAEASVQKSALKKAKSELRAANKDEMICKLTVIGNTSIIGGITFEIAGFGMFNGKYIVDSSTHNVDNGYTTEISAHKVLKGY